MQSSDAGYDLCLSAPPEPLKDHLLLRRRDDGSADGSHAQSSKTGSGIRGEAVEEQKPGAVLYVMTSQVKK